MNHSNDFVALCADAKTRVQETTIDAVMAKLNAQQPFLLIDVREADEYAAGALPHAVHLSKGWIEAKIHQLAAHKDTDIVLYCGGGNRSLLAADNLQKMGYNQVRSMQGGYRAYIAYMTTHHI